MLGYTAIMTLQMIALAFMTVTQTHELPAGLISAVCWVESHHNMKAYVKVDGNSPSIGPCQLKFTSAQLAGFRGTPTDLAVPTTNIYWSGAYLRKQIIRYDGDIVKAVAAYNAGSHRENAQGLTINRKYVTKVFAAWAEGR